MVWRDVRRMKENGWFISNPLILAFNPCSTPAILDVIPEWRKWDCIINVIAGERSNWRRLAKNAFELSTKDAFLRPLWQNDRKRK